MTKFDRYILSQLMGPFAFFSLILAGVIWINRALGFFDRLIGDGQSIYVFLEFTALFLPQVIAIVMPVAAFCTAVYTTNRLLSESEVVVMQAVGMSPFRLARPFVYFGFLVFLFASLLSHVLVPISRNQLELRQVEVSHDVTSKLLVERQFIHPTPGVTLYVRRIEASGELFDLFLHDERAEDAPATYTAQRALLLRNGGEAKLVMFDGMIQVLDTSTRGLSKVQFDDFTYDMSKFIEAGQIRKRTERDFTTWQTLRPTAEMMAETGQKRVAFLYEAHDRITQPINPLVYAVVGVAALLLGSYSRFGVLINIVGAVVFVIGLGLIGGNMRSLVLANESLVFLLYVPPMVGACGAWWMLWLSYKARSVPSRMPPLVEGAR